MALVYKTPVETTHRPSDLELQQNFETIANNIARVVVATQETVHLALLGLRRRGQVLVEDRPGVGKTMLTKAIAQSIEGTFTRVGRQLPHLKGNLDGLYRALSQVLYAPEAPSSQDGISRVKHHLGLLRHGLSTAKNP